jgi:hypothetical protein
MFTKEQIVDNLNTILSTVEAFEGLEPFATVEYLGRIVALQALCTETQAGAKYLLLCAQDEELDRQAKALGEHKVPPSIAKLRADAKCREMHYLYEKAQRTSSAVSHTIEACRTKISYLKMEMENSKFA